MIARVLGAVIVCAPLISAVLLGLHRAAHAIHHHTRKAHR